MNPFGVEYARVRLQTSPSVESMARRDSGNKGSSRSSMGSGCARLRGTMGRWREEHTVRRAFDALLDPLGSRASARTGAATGHRRRRTGRRARRWRSPTNAGTSRVSTSSCTAATSARPGTWPTARGVTTSKSAAPLQRTRPTSPVCGMQNAWRSPRLRPSLLGENLAAGRARHDEFSSVSDRSLFSPPRVPAAGVGGSRHAPNVRHHIPKRARYQPSNFLDICDH